MKFYLIVVLSLFMNSVNYAQNLSWKKLVKQGDDLMEAGKYLEAGKSYQIASKMKPEKEKIASKAGAAFVRARDYKTALKMLHPISKESKDYPLAAFWYAKSLKGMGNFDKASKAFRGFRRRYPGAKTDHVLMMTEAELEGCVMAMDWEGIPVDQEAHPLPLSTMANEFGAVPFSEDIIYYSTDQQGMTTMKRTQFAGGKWSEAVEADFPGMPAGHVGQGAFSVDKTAFYFTVCDGKKPWDSRDMDCDIYAMKRTGDAWSAPEKLRDYIKGDGSSATHPFAYSDGENEVLIYSSNQSGGQGGFDLWKTNRPLDSDEFDFSFPEHMGTVVNTMGDEITPFVNTEEQNLYFSSNGLPNVGGYDIYSVELGNIENGVPTNMGYPWNSNADDYYFRSPENSTVQFFTSNRATADWETTTDDNIFQVGAASDPVITLVGNVKNRTTEENIDEAVVMVIETMDDGREVLMTTQATKNGAFNLPLLTDKNYTLEISAEGHVSNEVKLDMADLNRGNMAKDVYLKPNEIEAVTMTSPVPTNISPSTSVATTTNVPERVLTTHNLGDSVLPRRNPVTTPAPSTNDYTPTTTYTETTVSTPTVAMVEETEEASYSTPATESNVSDWVTQTKATETTSFNAYAGQSSSSEYTNSRFDGDGVRTEAPKHEGSYYKIQLSIVVDYNPNDSDYERVSDLGRLDTEFIIARKWTRVLLADYFSKEEALRVLQEARNRGFVEAFLVRYQDGYRKI